MSKFTFNVVKLSNGVYSRGQLNKRYPFGLGWRGFLATGSLSCFIFLRFFIFVFSTK